MKTARKGRFYRLKIKASNAASKATAAATMARAPRRAWSAVAGVGLPVSAPMERAKFALFEPFQCVVGQLDRVGLPA